MLVASLIVALHVAGSTPSVVDQATRIHLAQADAPPPAPPAPTPGFDGSSSVLGDQRTLYQLTREYQKLESERPGLGFPIAFMVIGTAVLLVDGLLLIYAAVGLSTLFIPPVYIVLGVIGLGFLVPGIIVLPFRLKKRAEVDAQLNDLSELIRLREAQQPQQPPGYPPPGYYDAPPPPPPPPPPPAPTGMWPVPETSVALLAF
jgi:hypothetical protein